MWYWWSIYNRAYGSYIEIQTFYFDFPRFVRKCRNGLRVTGNGYWKLSYHSARHITRRFTLIRWHYLVIHVSKQIGSRNKSYHLAKRITQWIESFKKLYHSTNHAIIFYRRKHAITLMKIFFVHFLKISSGPMFGRFDNVRGDYSTRAPLDNRSVREI